MENTLNKIQKLAKAGLIISKIILYCCCVGLFCCVLVLISRKNVVLLENIAFGNATNIKEAISIGDYYCSTTTGIIMCIMEIILSVLSIKFFKKELEIGTPFNLEITKQMKKLGIRFIYVPLIAIITSSIAHECFSHYYEGVKEIDFSNSTSIDLGLAFLVISLICKYGAQLIEERTKPNE